MVAMAASAVSLFDCMVVFIAQMIFKVYSILNDCAHPGNGKSEFSGTVLDFTYCAHLAILDKLELRKPCKFRTLMHEIYMESSTWNRRMIFFCIFD